MSREQGLRLVNDENRPRYPTIKWYTDAVGIDYEHAIRTINSIPKLYMAEGREDRAQTIWLVSKYASPREYGFETRLFAIARVFREMGFEYTMVIISQTPITLGLFPPFGPPTPRNRSTG